LWHESSSRAELKLAREEAGSDVTICAFNQSFAVRQLQAKIQSLRYKLPALTTYTSSRTPMIKRAVRHCLQHRLYNSNTKQVCSQRIATAGSEEAPMFALIILSRPRGQGQAGAVEYCLGHTAKDKCRLRPMIRRQTMLRTPITAAVHRCHYRAKQPRCAPPSATRPRCGAHLRQTPPSATGPRCGDMAKKRSHELDEVDTDH